MKLGFNKHKVRWQYLSQTKDVPFWPPQFFLANPNATRSLWDKCCHLQGYGATLKFNISTVTANAFLILATLALILKACVCIITFV